MITTPETQQRAQQVFDYLRMHVPNHDQANWVEVKDSWEEGEKPDSKDFCNTTMCIAGAVVAFEHGVLFAHRLFDYDSNTAEEMASELLGLDYESEAYKLFYEEENFEALVKLSHIAEGDVDSFELAH